jgi:hypothetical protein
MDYTNIVIAGCTVVVTVLSLTKLLGKKFEKIDSQLTNINTELKSIDQRLSRLEGAFLERGQWEGRLYSMQKIMEKDAQKN